MKHTEDQVRGLLERQCKDAGGQKAWADLHNISAAYVSDVLNARRDIGRTIAEALGLQRVCFYESQQMAPRETRRDPGEG